MQQLSGKKKRYLNMRREGDDELNDWCLPPRPEVQPITMNGGDLIKHSMGVDGIRSDQVVKILRSIADHAARQIEAEQALGEDKARTTTAMHAASASGDVGIVLMLLQSKATLVHAVDETGDTPLHCAAQNGYLSAVTLLFDGGALATVKNNNGETPIDVTSQLNVREHLTRQVEVRLGRRLILGTCAYSVLFLDGADHGVL